MMSSSRESVGDLIPLDMLQVFSEERQYGRGNRGSRRAASFRRAFKWFKSQRRKKRRHATEKHDLLATGSPVELPPSTPNTGHKEEDVGNISLQRFQENVFVEGDRPKYVLDLHTEAQQGLKLQQQEDDRNGVDYPDDQSMISTVTAQTEDSMAFSELRGFESESTAADSVSMRSSISSRSTRSGLKRQASTFRPLKPDKSAEKTKSRRKHVRTVGGIPRHVQRELGLDRAAWITTSPLDDQLFNGDVIIPTIINTTDGTSSSSEQESVQDHPLGRENLRTVKEDQTELPTLAKIKDAFLQRPMDPSVDPGALVVPENATGAVMSMSPQATYLSKIIPNAVLPPSVDVVELSRSRSRSSVRTVSKSSLVSASPASTRASSRVSSHRSTTRSDYSGWSHSGSSETLVSNSSTISSSSTPRVASRGSQVENTVGPVKLNNNSSHVPFKPTKVNGDSMEDSKKTGSPGTFRRNLSVMKRSKLPPAPPNRSYSLRNGKQNWKRYDGPSDLTDVSIPDGSPYPCVTAYETNVSAQELSLKRTEIQPFTEKKNVVAGAPHSYTNGTSKLAELRETILSAKSLNSSSPALMALLSLLEIPTHPEVVAPPAPPPETWAHNQRTFELLCGPGPVNYARWAKNRGIKVADEPDIALGNKLQPLKLKGKVESLVSASCVTPSPSPPPEHCPPEPVKSHAKPPPPPPDFVPSTPTLAAKAIKDLTSWIPPPPLFPPPAPPVSTAASAPCTLPIDNNFPLPPPPFSPQTLQSVPQLPPGDPPPPPPQVVPPQPIPPSEPQKIASPPKEFRTSTQDVTVSVTSRKSNVSPPLNDVISQIVNIPPPLPVDVRSQVNVAPPPLPSDVRTQQAIVSPPQLHTSQPVNASPSLRTSVDRKQVIIPPPAPPLPTDAQSHQAIVPPPPQFTDVKSHVIVPPAPPLPLSTEVKTEEKLEMTEPEKRTGSPSPAKDETSIPVVTQSLLQMVRLRSVKSSQSQVAELDKPSQGKPNSASQEAPPKPMRRSLIMTTLPPDVEALCNTEPKTESPSNAVHAKTTTVTKTREPETKPNHIDNTRVEPACSLAAEPSNTSAPSEPVTKQPGAEPDLKPQTLKEQIEVSVPDPKLLQSKTEPKDQSIIQPQTQLQAQEPQKTQHISEKKSNGIEIPSKVNVDQPKMKTPTPVVTSTPPVGPSPASPSMRLQDAIRMKAAAMSSKDNQTKRFGLRSPPPGTQPNSPASTASFIFSKSPKKVVIETPSSLEVQADLKKTLVAEFTNVSESAKSNNSQKMANKVPPPIAKKPNGKVESVVQNSAESQSAAKTDHKQTETVQTAGQEVQTENSERATKE